MTAGLLDRAVADHRAVGRQSVHLATGAALRAHMDRLRSNGCSIVTLVRDPIAREVSNAFQTPELVGLDGRDASRDPAEVVALLRRRLMEDGPILYMESWFGQELELATGVNVFDYPFDMQRGWSIIERNGIRLLLLRVEDLTSQGPAALGSLLGSDMPLGVVDGNVRAATADGEIYGSVRQRLRLPADLVERIYGSSFMRHFYSESTLADFARQWSDDA